jgi:hypothetical protein
MSLRSSIAYILFSSLACQYPSLSPIEDASQLVIVSGDNQSGAAGQQLTKPLVVVAEDANGAYIAGVTVTFTSTLGSTVSPPTVTTDSTGLAQTMVTLGTIAGAEMITATESGIDGAPVVFDATVTSSGASGASRVVLVSGNSQSATVGSALPAPLIVRVEDAGGAAVANFPISFVVSQGGGSIPAGNTTTNAAGSAEATFDLGPMAGANSAQAIASNLLGSPVSFSEQSLAGAPTQLVIVSGNNQNVTQQQRTLAPLVVAAEDVHGNPVAGVPVMFMAIDTPCDFEPESASITTGSNGEAIFDSQVNAPNQTVECSVEAQATDLLPVEFAINEVMQ